MKLLSKALADLRGVGARWPWPHQDTKTPSYHIAMYVFGVSILCAFDAAAQFCPLQFYSLDSPVIKSIR